MDRLDTILHNLRRRDNIRDFIRGLEDSECWPYPNGEERPIAATCSCCDDPIMAEVNIRQDKIEELTHLYLINVYRYHRLAPFSKSDHTRGELTDVSIELCPEEGLGAYAVSYEAADEVERIEAPKFNLHHVATIRSAFMHRYEWVINKLHSINRDRLNASRRSESEYEREACSDDERSEAPLSEEEDYDALSSDDGCGGSKDDSEQEEDDAMLEPTLVVVRPAVKSARDSSLTSDQQEATLNGELGCEPAFGPSARPKETSVSLRNAPSTNTSRTASLNSFVAGRSPVDNLPERNPRKRAREDSVEL